MKAPPAAGDTARELWRKPQRRGKAVVQTVITKHVGAKVPVANPLLRQKKSPNKKL